MQGIHKTEDFNSTINSKRTSYYQIRSRLVSDCKAMDMWIDPITEKYNNYHWYVVDRDELEDVTTENDVMGIPSILIFQNGEKLAHLHSANAKSPEQVESFLDENLNQ